MFHISKRYSFLPNPFPNIPNFFKTIIASFHHSRLKYLESEVPWLHLHEKNPMVAPQRSAASLIRLRNLFFCCPFNLRLNSSFLYVSNRICARITMNSVHQYPFVFFPYRNMYLPTKMIYLRFDNNMTHEILYPRQFTRHKSIVYLYVFLCFLPTVFFFFYLNRKYFVNSRNRRSGKTIAFSWKRCRHSIIILRCLLGATC